MTVEELSIDDKRVRDFVEKHNGGIYARHDWFTILNEGLRSKVRIFGLIDNDSLKMLIPGVVLDFKIIKMFYSNIPYGGFIGPESYIPSFLPLLETALRRKGIGIFRICKQYFHTYPDLPGYRVQRGIQQVKSIEGLTEETNWESYKKRVRRDVRKAEKSGVIVKPITDRSQMEILFGLYLKTVKRNDTYPVWTLQSFYSIYDHLVLRKHAQVVFADLNGTAIAGVISIFSQDTGYYFMSASDTDYLACCPNDLLLHQLISVSIARQLKYVDLMTSRETDRHLIEFKDKWDTQQHPFSIFEKDLLWFRAALWGLCWKAVNSKTGSSLLRLWRR